MTNPDLDTLRERLGEVADIHSALSLLQWDQEVYMPPKGATARGMQLATLSALHHRLFTSPEMGDLLKRLSDQADTLESDDAKLVSETLYDYEHATKLPEAFVHENAREQSKAFEAWHKARKESNFGMFQPNLAKLVELQRQKAEYLGYEESPYDALIEEFERGMTAKQLKAIFGELATKQSALVSRIMESSKQPDVDWVFQDWDEDRQYAFTFNVLKDMGYDFEAGRQDKSVHPFTLSLDRDDVRVTTRVAKDELFSALTGSVHEGGHALYEQGYQEKDQRTPLADGISLGVHESQSRMWENMIGRSLPFWKHYTPLLKKTFPGQLDNVTAEMIYGAINKVEPSFIRVEADECTYNLHIILRFEIELALIEGSMEVGDVPAAWNEKMKQYLGLDVPNDAQGCLQDIHWSHGTMGYFPTYALGNLYAAQMFERIEQDIPDLWAQVSEGNFCALLGWLREHVHRFGRRKLARELIEDISGRALENGPYLAYLERKYGALYGI